MRGRLGCYYAGPLRPCPPPLQGTPKSALGLPPLLTGPDYIKFFERQGRPEIQAELPHLKSLLEHMKDKTSNEWAHRDCISEHLCYTDAGRALIRKLETPEEKAKRLPGEGPKPTPNNYTWGKVGKHVWGNLEDGEAYSL